ncbi:MAG: 16S rRNA (guanine(966)-N(2))-methyltransferase RsmD [Actinobacteria bacterium]|nr:16S rRNA (guanine(966)-N(2))-methyltransferase RsmD [Actinomycetota bacterium]
MRIVAGKAGGIRLSAPKGIDIRPTSDRAKEAVFNSLHSRSAIEGAEVLDLFAGTGALGIEALSRGAKKATFVDKSSESLKLIKENLKKSGFEKTSEIVKEDSLKWLQKSSKSLDLVLLDPPYGFKNWSELLDAILQKQPGIVVIESNREIDPGPNWHVDSIRQYGSSVVVVIDPK